MAEITTFKKKWLPEGFVLMSRMAESGAPTFALAWDDLFPKPIGGYSDMPLGNIKKLVTTAARYHRRAGWVWYDRAKWTKALLAAELTLWKFAGRHALPRTWEERRFCAEWVWHAPEVSEGTLAKLRNTPLTFDFSDDD